MNRGSLPPLLATPSAFWAATLPPLPTLAALSVLACAGCTNLDGFTSAKTDAYCGAITLGGFFRAGFSPRVQMRLRFDASQIDGADPAGTISTYEAAVSGLPEQRMFDEVPLRHIPAVSDDPISHLEFGEGRLRNAMFAVTPTPVASPNAAFGGDAGADGGSPVIDQSESLLAVVSLDSDDSVQVRLIRPGVATVGDTPPPAGHGPLFGLFPLTRQVGSCGF